MEFDWAIGGEFGGVAMIFTAIICNQAALSNAGWGRGNAHGHTLSFQDNGVPYVPENT